VSIRLRQCWFRLDGRRAVALLLALFVMTVAAAMAAAYLTSQGNSLGIARNVSNNARARCVAESALDLTMAYIRAHTDWRTVQHNGTWATNQSLCGGLATVTVEDGQDTDGDGLISLPAEGDGDLANNPTDKFTVTVTSKVERRNAANELLSTAYHLTRAEVRITGGDLSSYWGLDEGSGATVSGGEGQTGRLINMDPTTSWAEGYSGTALRFNGVNSYVTMPDTSAVEITTAGTVAAWININSFKNTFAGVVHKGTRTDFNDEAYSLQFWSGNKIYWGITTASGAHPNVQSPAAPPTGTWVHVLGTWDSSAMKLYVNGALVASGPGVESIRSPGAFNIGAQLDGSPYYGFDGLIDDVRVYNRALTPDEVTTVAAGGAPQSLIWTYLVDLR
jgi:hypothetical protein